MTEEKFSPEQSLQLIHTMISKAREDLSGNSFYFLLWGWITFACCTGQFILKTIIGTDQHYQVWWLVIFGVAASVWYSIKKDRTRKVKTYISESMKYLWMGMGIAYFVLSMILTHIGWGFAVFPFFIMLYGLGSFISGCFLRFKPLITGGIVAWVLAVGAAYVSYDYQMLFGAVAILASYIVPAYMLRSKIKQSHKD